MYIHTCIYSNSTHTHTHKCILYRCTSCAVCFCCIGGIGLVSRASICHERKTHNFRQLVRRICAAHLRARRTLRTYELVSCASICQHSDLGARCAPTNDAQLHPLQKHATRPAKTACDLSARCDLSAHNCIPREKATCLSTIADAIADAIHHHKCRTFRPTASGHLF